MYTLFAILSGLLITVVLVGRRYDALSHLSTVYLRFRYPIKSADNREDLPTLPFVWPNGQGNIEKYLRGRENSAKWGVQYGSIYRIWSGFHGEIILTTPADIETVFRDSHTHLKANANDSGHYMYRLLGICLGLISGSDWRSLRKATENPFTRTATTSYVGAVMKHANLHVKSLRASKPEKWHLKPIQDLRVREMGKYADILYGTLTPELKARLLQMIPLRDSVFAHMIMGGVTRYAWARYLPLKANREMKQFKAQWAQWNDDAHAEALQRQTNAEGRNSQDSSAPIVAMYAAAKEGMTTHEALYQTLDEMLFANLDVSIGALAWSMTFIAAHKHVQTRLLSEIDAALRDSEATSSYLLSQSNYLHHIILEGARLRPVAAFSVAQACPTARQVGPYVLPAGSKFVVDAYALNVRDPLWAPDNTTFRPERWAEGGVQRAKDVRYCYWRFGFGPRVCLGKYVVDLMMKALIVEVLRGAEVRLEDAQGEEWKWEQDTWALPPELRIACVKR